jgi:hypothetical protein
MKPVKWKYATLWQRKPMLSQYPASSQPHAIINLDQYYKNTFKNTLLLSIRSQNGAEMKIFN